MPRSNRTFPELVNIKDRSVHETLRQNWQKTYDHDESLESLTSRISSLEATVSSLQTRIADLERFIRSARIDAAESA